MDWKYLYLATSGRIGQKDFWIGTAILFVVSVVAGFIPAIGGIIQIVLLYPAYCLAAKRLHDMGKPGTFAAVAYGVLALTMIPLIFATFAAMAALSGNPGVAVAGAGAAFGMAAMFGMLAMLAALACLALVLWIGLSKGEASTNQYGAPRGSMFDGGSTTTPAV